MSWNRAYLYAIIVLLLICAAYAIYSLATSPSDTHSNKKRNALRAQRPTLNYNKSTTATHMNSFQLQEVSRPQQCVSLTVGPPSFLQTSECAQIDGNWVENKVTQTLVFTQPNVFFRCVARPKTKYERVRGTAQIPDERARRENVCAGVQFNTSTQQMESVTEDGERVCAKPITRGTHAGTWIWDTCESVARLQPMRDDNTAYWDPLENQYYRLEVERDRSVSRDTTHSPNAPLALVTKETTRRKYLGPRITDTLR